MKLIVSFFIAALTLSAPAYAAFTLNVSATDLRTSGGDPIPTNSLVLLVGDTSNDGFGDFTLSADSSLAVGSSFGSSSDDVILFNSGAVADGVGAFALDNFELGTYNLNTGDRLILVWFPTLTPAASTPGNNVSFGTFRTDTIIDGSTIGWFTPSDSSVNSLNVSSPQLANFTTVPEPSSLLLLGTGCLGMMLRRRR